MAQAHESKSYAQFRSDLEDEWDGLPAHIKREIADAKKAAADAKQAAAEAQKPSRFNAAMWQACYVFGGPLMGAKQGFTSAADRGANAFVVHHWEDGNIVGGLIGFIPTTCMALWGGVAGGVTGFVSSGRTVLWDLPKAFSKYRSNEPDAHNAIVKQMFPDTPVILSRGPENRYKSYDR